MSGCWPAAARRRRCRSPASRAGRPRPVGGGAAVRPGRAGRPGRAPPGVFVESLQRHGAFRSVVLRDNQVPDPRSLLALRVNGADLSPDHGYPARIIVPAPRACTTPSGSPGAGVRAEGLRFRRRYGEPPSICCCCCAPSRWPPTRGVRLLHGDWLGIVLWFAGADRAARPGAAAAVRARRPGAPAGWSRRAAQPARYRQPRAGARPSSRGCCCWCGSR